MRRQTDRRGGTRVAPRGRDSQGPSWARFGDWDTRWRGSACVVRALLVVAALPAPSQSSQVKEPPAVSEVGTTSCPEDIARGRNALEPAPHDGALEAGLARLLTACGEYPESVAYYRRILQDQPQSVSTLTELGETLLRAGRPDEALPVFRLALQFIPNSTGAALGLARALAATGNYEGALQQYGECLQGSPEDYDALQGEAFVLDWTHRFPEARTIFQGLLARQPSDRQNAEALEHIAAAEEESRWEALRPPAGSPPADFLRYYFNGLRNDVYYMGFFTPSFYQRQLLTTRLQGKLWGPAGYDFSGGIGLQQIEQGRPVTSALSLNPAFTLRVSPRLSLRLGYTYYDSAPGLGKVSGNAVLLSTDYKF